MRLLSKHWHNIPDRFTDDILDGAATYLALCEIQWVMRNYSDEQ
jgi:hypothetical protein